MIPATWCNSSNIGDRLTPWLIEQMTGRQPVYVDHRDPIDKVLACGSILAWANEHATVWGSGILARSDVVSPLADIRAVRGPLSREVALNCGAACPEVYGDPALLVPTLLPLDPDPYADRVGFCPHYVDHYRLLGWQPPARWTFLNVFAEVEDFCRALCHCRVVVSSSLHGLILADAFGVPSCWVQMGGRLGGDGVKFLDYLASVGRDPGRVLNWRKVRAWPPDAFIRSAELGNVAPLIEPLLAACPWRDDLT